MKMTYIFITNYNCDHSHNIHLVCLSHPGNLAVSHPSNIPPATQPFIHMYLPRSHYPRSIAHSSQTTSTPHQSTSVQALDLLHTFWPSPCPDAAGLWDKRSSCYNIINLCSQILLSSLLCSWDPVSIGCRMACQHDPVGECWQVCGILLVFTGMWHLDRREERELLSLWGVAEGINPFHTACHTHVTGIHSTCI